MKAFLLKPKTHKLKTDRGFTLVEMIVSVGLFAIVMVVATGAILTIINTNRTAQSLNSVITNLNFAVESMMRDVRTGSTYQCNATDNIQNISPTDCITGGSSLAFETSEGNFARYYFDNGAIMKEYQNIDPNTGLVTDTPTVSITAPEVIIDSLTFYVTGSLSASAVPADFNQPRILVRIKGHAGSGKDVSSFDVQSFVSQRLLDI